MNELKPYEPIHPGEMLREELEARKIKQKDFAELIQLSYSMLSEILNGKKPISADVALRLEVALGVKAYLWVKMQADYNLQIASLDKNILSRLDSIRHLKAAMML